MKHEMQTTTRLEWTKFRDETQNDVNEILNDLGLEIEAANLYIAQLYSEERTDELVTFINGKVEEFDTRWGYIDDFFMVSGTWYEPQTYVGNNGILVEHTVEPTLCVAKSNGFIAHVVGDGEETEAIPQIGYSFLMEPVQFKSNMIHLAAQPLAFAEFNAVSLQYIRPGKGEDVVSAEIDEIFDRVARADSLIKLYTKTPYSRFYEQSAKKQQEFFADMIQMIDDAMPAPDALDALAVEIATHCVYLGSATDAYTRIDAPHNDLELELKGTILGFLSPNQLSNDRARRFTKPEDLIDDSCSLLAIVQVVDQNFLDEHSFQQGTTLLVPLDDIVSLSAQLV